jgi:hypothetical protein
MGTYVSRLATRALRVPVENEPKPIGWIGLGGRDGVSDRRDERVDCLAGCRLARPVAAATASISFCSFMTGPLCSLCLSPDLISPPSRARAVAWTYQRNWPYHERPRQQV